MNSKNRRGQIHISFGMIFSIIMIIVFISFAVFGIQKFLGIQKNIQINQFYDNLQTDVNVVWNSAQSNQEKSYDVPSSIGKICFSDAGEDNMIVYDEGGRPTGGIDVNYVDITAIVTSGNPCFEKIGGEITLVLKKDFEDVRVTIEH